MAFLTTEFSLKEALGAFGVALAGRQLPAGGAADALVAPRA